jgi:hypothetical protein
MKKVIRLTESDLARIVKRVIKESKGILNEGNGTTAFQTIQKGMSGMGTDENMVAKGVYMIKSKADYQECLDLVKKQGFNSIMDWISTDWTYVDPGTDFGVSSGTNIQIQDLGRHLRQFNPVEKYRTTTAMGKSPGRY